MASVLIAAPYWGEFGWEAGGWVPWCRYLFRARRCDRAVAFCRRGHEALYEFASEHIVINGGPEDSLGHHIQRGSGREPDWAGIKQACTLRDSLANEGNSVVFVSPPVGPLAWERKLPARLGHLYQAPPGLLESWRKRLVSELEADHFVVCCVRAYSRTPAKNLTQAERGAVQEACHRLGYSVVGVGRPDEGMVSSAGLDLDLQSRTETAEDLIAIFELADCVIGRSTGTLHLASACGRPHCVWMANRMDYVKQRYEVEWNDQRAPVVYWHRPPDVAALAAAIGSLAKAGSIADRRAVEVV